MSDSVENLKAKGNADFAQGKWEDAKAAYTKAIQLSEEKDAKLKGTLFSNRSATCAMLEDYPSALADAEQAIRFRPSWARGYARKAVALIGRNKIQAAAESVQQGMHVDPDDKMLKELSVHIKEIQKPNAVLKRKAPEGSTFSEALDQIQAAGVEHPLSVVVLSGFLGSGKTTLLNRILHNNQGTKRIAVFVNDMAAVNIDADLVRQGHTFSEVTEELVELTNGCVCCTLRGDLIKEATKILCLKRFDVLLIEATGISEPMPVAATFSSADFHGVSLKEYFKIDNMVTLVDGSRFLDELDKGASLKERQMEAEEDDQRTISQLLIDQVEFADTLLINKCDLISDDGLSRTRQLLIKLNPHAKLLESVQAEVDMKEILDTGRFCFDRAALFDGFETELIAPHTSETEEYGIGSIVFSSKLPFHPTRLHTFFFGKTDGDESQISEDSVLKHIYRSKGFFYLASYLDAKLTWSTAGRSVSFELSDRWLASMMPEHIWPDDPDWHPTFGDRQQNLVLIGTASVLPQIHQSLTSCLLTNAEIAAGPSVWQTLDAQSHWTLDSSCV